MKKTSERKKLIKLLTKEFNAYIRERDRTCLQCKEVKRPMRGILNAGHVLTCVPHSTKWDEANVFGQCAGCNFRHEHHPQEMILWYIQKFGLVSFEELIKLHNTTIKFTVTDLKAMRLNVALKRSNLGNKIPV